QTEGACGKCATILTDGAPCDPVKSYCDIGLYCDAASKKCAPMAKDGQACSAAVPCAGILGCISGTCGARRAEGAACSVGECHVAVGLYCNDTTKKCEKLGVAKLSEACGVDVMTGAITVCEPGTRCDDISAGKCVARPKEGDSCAVDASTHTSD